MILLIGGSSHVGKTLAAQKLMERLHWPYLCLDHLKMAFIRTGMTHLTVEEDEKMRSFLWPFAAEIIKTAIENEQNLIVEGCYIPDTWRNSFSKAYLDRIRCVFLVMSEAYIQRNFDAIQKYADAIEQRLDDRPDQTRLIACSKGFREDCIEANIPYLEIADTFQIDEIVDRICAIAGLYAENTEG